MRTVLNLEVIVLAEYKTHQREAVIGFLADNPEKQFSVDELAEQLRADYGEKSPGKSTVYRLINRLVEDGSVKRYEKGNTRQSVYQITAGEECHHHLHMKCSYCGKLLHMAHEQSDELIRMIYGTSDFAVDSEQTTLYGCCKSCKLTEGCFKYV